MLLWTGKTLFGLDPISGHVKEVPDYLNDLNAMHEVENRLPNGWGPYQGVLNRILERQFVSHATAAQRVEAFLKQQGKWVNDS